jgi:hypothetical protein
VVVVVVAVTADLPLLAQVPQPQRVVIPAMERAEPEGKPAVPVPVVPAAPGRVQAVRVAQAGTLVSVRGSQEAPERMIPHLIQRMAPVAVVAAVAAVMGLAVRSEAPVVPVVPMAAAAAVLALAPLVQQQVVPAAKASSL